MVRRAACLLVLGASVCVGLICAARSDPPAEDRLGTQIIRCQEAWGLTHPDVLEVLPSGEIIPDRPISQFVHGIRNHPELHSPIRLRVRCARDGRFTARVIETSGYGGSGLRILLDGEVKLDEKFPGETDTTLRKYAGEYGIEVPAGEHEIVIDNLGADWTRIDWYRLTNYNPWRVDVEGGAITARVLDEHGRARVGARVTATTVIGAIELADRGDGTYRSPALGDRLERGLYPVRVEGRLAGRRLFATEARVAISHKRLLLRRAAFRIGDAPVIHARFTDESGSPISGAAVTATVGGDEIALAETDDPGHYRGAVRHLAAGRYPVVLSCDDPVCRADAWVVVYEPRDAPGPAEEIVRLRPDGWFETRAGEPFTPLGFATIHIFQPTFDVPVFEGWVESAWNHASTERVADWLGLLSTQGINVIRIGLTVKGDGVPGDMGGWVEDEFVESFRRFLGLCDSFGMRVIPVLYWGHWSTFGLTGVPAYEPLMSGWEDWYTDASAIKLQQEFTRQMVRPFADDPRVFAWEPMNEIRPAVRGAPDIPVQWTNLICEAIREVDKSHLVTISPITMEPHFHVYFAEHSTADFINYHFYADHTGPPRGIADQVAMCTRLNQRGGKPAILGEAGATGHSLGGRYPAWIRTATRDCYWASVLCGSPGFVGWDGTTTSPEENGILARILAESGWYGKRRDRAPVALVFRDLREELWALIEAEGKLDDRGVWFDVVAADADLRAYRTVLDVGDVEAGLEELPRLVEATPPYATIPMVADGGRWLLAFIRNEGGFDGHGNRWPRRTDLAVRVNLPGYHTMVVWDLNAREEFARMAFTDHGEFSAEGTLSDYVVWVASE